MKYIQILENYNTPDCDFACELDYDSKSEYQALLRFRKSFPDGKKLNIYKKKYREEEKWTLLLDEAEYVAELIDMDKFEYDESGYSDDLEIENEYFNIIRAATYNKKGVREEVVFSDCESRTAYLALLKFRKDNPDGQYLQIEKKRYGRRKRWTLSLNGEDFVAEKITEYKHHENYGPSADDPDFYDFYINDGWN